MKVSLNKESLKQFALENLEKLLFGIVVLVFLALAYRALSPDSLGFTSEDMLQAAQTAKTNLAKTEPTDVPKAPPYHAKAGENRKPVNFASFDLPKPFKEPLKRYDTKRGVPPLLALKELRATSGKGGFAMATEEDVELGMAPERQLRGQRWVVLTGLIDYAAQVDAYKQTFEPASLTYDPYRDVPSYAYFRVERAEVDPAAGDTDPDQLTWTRLNVRDSLGVQDLWTSQSSQEVVDPRFWPPNPVLMFPLGPTVDRAWGAEVAYLPQITLAEPEETGMGASPYGASGRPQFEKKGKAGGEDAEGEAKPGEAAKEEPADDLEKPAPKKKQPPRKRVRSADTPDEPDEPGTGPGPGGYAMSGSSSVPGSGYGGMRTPGYGGMRSPMGSGSSMPMPSPMRPGSMSPPMGSSRGASMPPGYMAGGRSPSSMPGSGVSRPSAGMPGYGAGMPGYGSGMAGQGAEEEIPPPEQYLLFRFFDFSVQPGKHYRYRVKLVLDNPNLGFPQQHLMQPDQAKQKRMETEWCQASPAVSVALDSQVLALSAERKLQDTLAKVLVVNFNMETGLDAFEEVDAPRGQWLNFAQREFERPGGFMGGMTTMGMGGYGSGASGMGALAASEETTEKVDYFTNCLVLDVAGGAKLPGKEKDRLIEPAGLLLLDKDGNLVVRGELDDLAEAHRYKPPEEAAGSTTGMSTPGGPGSMPPMGPGYMGSGPKSKKGTSSGSSPPSSMPPGYEEMMGASRKMGGKGGKKMGPGSSSSGYPGNLEGLDDSRKKKGAKLPRP